MEAKREANVIFGGELVVKCDRDYASFGDMMVSELKKGSDKPAFINGVTDQTWSYRDTLEQSIIIARTLHGAGVKQNDIISIVSENRFEYATICFGILYLNAAISPINVTYTERELTHVLGLSKPKMVFVSAFAAKKIIETCKKLDYVEKVILIDGDTVDDFVVSLKDLIKKHESVDFNIDEQVAKKVDMKDQVAAIMCSSGTTGLPKGVMLTQTNIKSAVDGSREFIASLQILHDVPVIRFLNIAPWFHGIGIWWMFAYVSGNDSINVYLPKFEEKAFLNAIEKYQVTLLVMVPTIALLIAKSPSVDNYNLSSVREILTSGATLTREVEEKVRARLNSPTLNIRQGYGLTETTFSAISSMSTQITLKPGSVGKAVYMAYVKVIDENGKSLGPNQKGELCFKTDRVMKGYVDDSKSTSEIFDKDGWLHSGDVAYYDEENYFFVVDRLKELIKYKAFQVPPAEIEALLISNPKIKECAVIGIPDEEAGELPFAFVVKQPGVEITEKEVFDFVAENASKAKWLRGGVRFIDELPKNSNGKIVKKDLRQMFVKTD